jgi:hypothetical protein
MAKVPRIFQLQVRTLGPLAVNVGVKIGPGGVEGTTRYATLFGGMIAAGLVMSLAVGPMQGLRGVAGPTIALAATPVLAALVLLGTLVVSLGIAVLVGKAINAVVGLFVLGSGLAMLTMQCGTIADVVFLGAGQVGLAVETAIWAVVVLLCAAVVFRLAGPLPDVPVQNIDEAFNPAEVFSIQALKSALAGLLILPVVWLLLINDLKGQAIAAVTIGGIVAGMGGRLLSPRVQPILIFAAPIFVGALGHAISVTMMTGTPEEMFVANALPRIGRPMPLDYAAGALMGVAIGLGWSRSFVE